MREAVTKIARFQRKTSWCSLTRSTATTSLKRSSSSTMITMSASSRNIELKPPVAQVKTSHTLCLVLGLSVSTMVKRILIKQKCLCRTKSEIIIFNSLIKSYKRPLISSIINLTRKIECITTTTNTTTSSRYYLWVPLALASPPCFRDTPMMFSTKTFSRPSVWTSRFALWLSLIHISEPTRPY